MANCRDAFQNKLCSEFGIWNIKTVNSMIYEILLFIYFETKGEGPRPPCTTGAGIPSTIIVIKKELYTDS